MSNVGGSGVGLLANKADDPSLIPGEDFFENFWNLFLLGTHFFPCWQHSLALLFSLSHFLSQLAKFALNINSEEKESRNGLTSCPQDLLFTKQNLGMQQTFSFSKQPSPNQLGKEVSSTLYLPFQN